jgi:hypothetical protein
LSCPLFLFLFFTPWNSGPSWPNSWGLAAAPFEGKFWTLAFAPDFEERERSLKTSMLGGSNINVEAEYEVQMRLAK